MFILNFSHPLTPDALAQLETLTGARVDQVIPIAAQFANDQPLAPQVQALVAAAPLTPEEWQTQPLLLVLPSLNFAAAVLLAELHGRMGYFPAIVRTRPVAGSVPPRFEVAEIINLNDIREVARRQR